MMKEDKFGKMCKELMVNEIVSRFKERPNFFLTSYMGSGAQELELLRRSLKKSSSRYFVVKNSILKVVFDKRKLDEMSPFVDGGVGISLSGEDAISTCKTLVNFSKDHEKFKVKAGRIDGRNISAERIRELARLPARDVLLALVVGGMKSPITGFVNVLGGVLRKLVYVVDAIKVSKEGTAKN